MSNAVHPVQSRSLNARLLVQMSAAFEDKLSEFRRWSDNALDVTAIVDFMHELVNSKRARLFAKGPVERDLVVAADRAAAGHVDYERKLALYCVELVLDVQAPPV